MYSFGVTHSGSVLYAVWLCRLSIPGNTIPPVTVTAADVSMPSGHASPGPTMATILPFCANSRPFSITVDSASRVTMSPSTISPPPGVQGPVDTRLANTNVSAPMAADSTGIPRCYATAMRMLSALMLAALAACASDDPAAPDVPDVPVAPEVSDTPDVPEPEYCEGKTEFAWDPAGATLLRNFPDGYFQNDDGALVFDAETAPWVAQIPAQFQLVFDQLNTLDGFGTTAGIFLHFTDELGELPSGETDSVTDGRLMLVELSGPPTRIPYELRRTDEDTTIILMPMVPLTPATDHVVVLTVEATDDSGDCVNPGANLRAALDVDPRRAPDVDPRTAAVGTRLTTALAALALEPHQVSAALAFRTQSIEGTTRAIAAEIADAEVTFTADADCTATETRLDCARTFGGVDYRQDFVVTPTARNEYDIPIRIWLPLEGDGPWPTVVFGHGLSGNRHQAELLAEATADLGLVVVAIDAAEHGDHPAGTAGSQLEQVMAFFGISIATLSLDPLRLRDNWRQSTYDKLRLVRLLQTHPDLDGDGSDDVEQSQLIYFGVSLGAIMGPELLANTDAFGAAALAVGGSRVSTIIEEAAQFQIVIDLMKPEGTTDGDVARFFPVLQTLLERGDSGNYAPFVIRDRYEGAGAAPHLLVVNVIDDDTVPPGTNRMLARAIGAPHMPPIIEDVGIIDDAGPTPLSNNFETPSGTRTAAFFQYDRMTKKPGGSVEPATHSGVARSLEALLQAETFMQTWLETGAPTVIDPYSELSTPPL